MITAWKDTALDCHELDIIVGKRTKAGYTVSFRDGATCVVMGPHLLGDPMPRTAWFIRVRDTLTTPSKHKRKRVVTVSAGMDNEGQAHSSLIRKPTILMQLTAEDARKLGVALQEAADLNLMGRLTD